MKNVNETEKLLAQTPPPNIVEGPHKARLKRELLSATQQESATMRNWKRYLVAASIAAVTLVSTSVALNIFGGNVDPTKLAALDVFGQAVYAMDMMEELSSVHITARMRTKAHDNFELISVDYDFVPHEMWKEFSDPPKWRIEKSHRYVINDGKASLLVISGSHVARGGARTGFVDWLKPLLDVDKVLEAELKRARKTDSDLMLTHEMGDDGLPKQIVTIDSKAQGFFGTSDWLKNKSIRQSDNIRVYQFDAETKLLERLEVYVKGEQEDVLVFEITDIEYNVDIDPALFLLEEPDGATRFLQPKNLGRQYKNMEPEEVARAFFQAMAGENWEELLKFYPVSDVSPGFKKSWGGLEIISIGEPFKSGLYPGMFVPYEIKFKSGKIKKMNLAVRKDNRPRRYVVDGGF